VVAGGRGWPWLMAHGWLAAHRRALYLLMARWISGRARYGSARDVEGRQHRHSLCGSPLRLQFLGENGPADGGLPVSAPVTSLVGARRGPQRTP
jgi:hypothetical protein